MWNCVSQWNIIECVRSKYGITFYYYMFIYSFWQKWLCASSLKARLAFVCVCVCVCGWNLPFGISWMQKECKVEVNQKQILIIIDGTLTLLVGIVHSLCELPFVICLKLCAEIIPIDMTDSRAGHNTPIPLIIMFTHIQPHLYTFFNRPIRTIPLNSWVLMSLEMSVCWTATEPFERTIIAEQFHSIAYIGSDCWKAQTFYSIHFYRFDLIIFTYPSNGYWCKPPLISCGFFFSQIAWYIWINSTVKDISNSAWMFFFVCYCCCCIRHLVAIWVRERVCEYTFPQLTLTHNNIIHA